MTFKFKLVGIAVLLAALFFGAGLPFVDGQTGYAGLSPRFLPTLVTIGLVICGLMLLLRKGVIPPSTDEAATAINQSQRYKRLGLLAGGLVVHLILIGFIGFVLASGLLMTVVARAYGSKQPVRDASIGLAIAETIWLLFTKVLGLNLPLLPLFGI